MLFQDVNPYLDCKATLDGVQKIRSWFYPHENDVKVASDNSSVHGVVFTDILLYDCGIEASPIAKSFRCI